MENSFQKLNLTNAYLRMVALLHEEIYRNILDMYLKKRIYEWKTNAKHVCGIKQ